MKILLDENLDWRLARYLPGHEVSSVAKIGWAGIKNGELLRAAAEQFDALITLDGSIPYQHDLSDFDLVVICLRAKSNRLADTSPMMDQVLRILPVAEKGFKTVIPVDISENRPSDESTCES